jgi:hypothetical protein
MKPLNLEEESTQYADNHFVMQENHYQGLKQGFIAGVNSKYVQIEKLKFGIEILRRRRKEDYKPLLEDLQNQLKQLENE